MYNSLDILPVKTYFKIIETGNFFLLSFSDKKVAELELSELWNEINQAFQERDNNQANKRIFRISTDIEYLISKYNLIQMCVNTLRFDRNQEVIDILKSHNYLVTDKFYERDLNRTERNSKGILNKIELLKSQLPKEDNKTDSSIDDVLASYSNILGFHVGDFNKITCSEYLAFKKQVESKIKQQQDEINKIKSKKNGR